MAKESKAAAREVDFDLDRYPTVSLALRKILEDPRRPVGVFEYAEIHAYASGEVTYRIRAPRAQELEGGYLPAD